VRMLYPSSSRWVAKGMSQGVGRGPLHDPGPPDRTFHHALENGLVQVLPAPLAGAPVHIEARCGDDPLPYHSRPAFGSFRPSAVGSSTQPAPY
jgi:hypothetical protein